MQRRIARIGFRFAMFLDLFCSLSVFLLMVVVVPGWKRSFLTIFKTDLAIFRVYRFRYYSDKQRTAFEISFVDFVNFSSSILSMIVTIIIITQGL